MKHLDSWSLMHLKISYLILTYIYGPQNKGWKWNIVWRQVVQKFWLFREHLLVLKTRKVWWRKGSRAVCGSRTMTYFYIRTKLLKGTLNKKERLGKRRRNVYLIDLSSKQKNESPGRNSYHKSILMSIWYQIVTICVVPKLNVEKLPMKAISGW